MGTILFIVMCWYLVKGREDPGVRRKMKSVLGTIPKLIGGFFTIIFVTVAFSLLASGIFSAFSGLIPFIIIASIISKMVKSGKNEKKREKSIEYREIKQNVNQGAGYKLTQSTSKRVRIVSKFNKKFGLNLTDDQIERIMNASYVSYYWEKEIYDMTQDYNVQVEWLKSDTDWLRAYLMAFPVMDIASDFSVQKKIVVDAYYQIFKGITAKSYYSIDEMIKDVNNRYLVNFNEMTFMIAHKFLKQNGHEFELPRIGVTRVESDVEKLAREYDEMEDINNTPTPLAR
jgi:hypothetical protein